MNGMNARADNRPCGVRRGRCYLKNYSNDASPPSGTNQNNMGGPIQQRVKAKKTS